MQNDLGPKILITTHPLKILDTPLLNVLHLLSNLLKDSSTNK